MPPAREPSASWCGLRAFAAVYVFARVLVAPVLKLFTAAEVAFEDGWGITNHVVSVFGKCLEKRDGENSGLQKSKKCGWLWLSIGYVRYACYENLCVPYLQSS